MRSRRGICGGTGRRSPPFPGGILAREVAQFSLQHFVLVLVCVGLAAVIGIPLGIFLARQARLRTPVMGVVGVLQTVPSLAMFGFLIPLIGIGAITASVALVLYALLPIVRSTLTGLTTIDSATIESADGLGMSAVQRLRLVELPLAAPSILSGLRIAAVTTVGTATIAAVIGAGGLGELIFRGVATVDTQQILAGAAPAALMALMFEGAFTWIENRLYRRS